MPANREYEIKATFDPEILPAILAHPLLAEALSEATPAQMLSTYYDTDRCDLWQAGFSLRVRKTSGAIVQTLKQAGTSVLDRGEWEWTLDTDEIAFDVLADTPLGPHLDAIGGKLAPRFIVDVARTRFDVTFEATRIEGALDQGRINGDGKSVPVCEIELELKHGAPRDVVSLARLLVNDLPLVPSVRTKATRGFELVEAKRTEPQKGLHVALAADTSIRAAMETIVASCVQAMCLNAGLIASAERMEAVHQTRVAVRRLRAALLLFKPKLETSQAAHVQSELKWISSLLGAARDSDVHQSDVFDPAAEDRDAPYGSAHLAAVMRERQATAHATLAQGFTTARWRRLLLDLIAAPLARDIEDTNEAFEPFVIKRLKTRHRRLAGMTKRLGDVTPDLRHEVRKKAKALRYAYSFFEDSLSKGRKKRVGATLKALGTLQETLGELHDHDALRDLLRAHAEEPAAILHRQPEDVRIASMFAAGALAEKPIKQKALLAKAERALQKIRAEAPF